MYSFDAYLWQIQEQKLRYITQIMTSKSVSRSCEDTDETVLTAAEIKAIATSNPLLAEKMNVDNEVTRLKLLKENWTNERIVLESDINTHYPGTIARSEERIENIKRDIAVLDKHKGGDFIIEIDGKRYRPTPQKKILSLPKILTATSIIFSALSMKAMNFLRLIIKKNIFVKSMSNARGICSASTNTIDLKK